GVGPEVVDRSLEERDIGARYCFPDRGEGVARAREEVARGLLHLLIAECDHDRTDDHCGDHGEERDDRVTGRDLSPRTSPPRWLGPSVRASARGRRRRKDLRLGPAHASAPSFMPAIMRPRRSREVSPGTIPTTRP